VSQEQPVETDTGIAETGEPEIRFAAHLDPSETTIALPDAAEVADAAPEIRFAAHLEPGETAIVLIALPDKEEVAIEYASRHHA
jgi:hypothetical protein